MSQQDTTGTQKRTHLVTVVLHQELGEADDGKLSRLVGTGTRGEDVGAEAANGDEGLVAAAAQQQGQEGLGSPVGAADVNLPGISVVSLVALK